MGVARVHARETRLLGAGDIQQLMACKTCDECLRVLTDKGWGAGDGNASPEAMLAAEEEKTWAFLKELTQDLEPFQALLAPADYNNLKAAIKCAGTGAPPEHVFPPRGDDRAGGAAALRAGAGLLPSPPCHGPGRRGGLPPLPEHPGRPAVRHHLDRACLQAIQACGERTGGLGGGVRRAGHRGGGHQGGGAGLPGREKPGVHPGGPGPLRHPGHRRPGRGRVPGPGGALRPAGRHPLQPGGATTEGVQLRL